MAQYWTSKYGTKIDVTGLSSEQIAKVKQMAEGNGAYGAKGAALADTFRKKQNNGANNGKANQDNFGVNNSTGQINTGNLVGNVDQRIDPETQNQYVDQSRDEAYKYLTRYNDQDKAKELESAKQELAQRGIPLDPSPDSLYSKTLAQIDRKYQDLNDQAQHQSILEGTNLYNSEVQGAQSSTDAFLKAVLGASAADLQAFGITQDQQAKMAAIAAQRRSGGGRSGGGSDNSGSPIIGGSAPGFGV